MSTQEKLGIILANTGTPSEPTPQAVKKYLAQFLSDKRIVPMNPVIWWFILRLAILPRRSKVSAAKYEAVWMDKGSPLLVLQEALASNLQRSLQKEGFEKVQVLSAMSFGEPSIPTVLENLREAGCEKLVVLPLYPQSAHSTTKVVEDAVAAALAKLDWNISWQLIGNYHAVNSYANALARSIQEAGFNAAQGDKLLLSYHSIPLVDVAAGDTYQQQCEATSAAVARALGITDEQLSSSYQCRFDKGRDWLGPFTKETLVQEAANKKGRLFFVCPGFSVDCLETLYDIPHELLLHYENACTEAGVPLQEGEFVYVPCLNESQAHVEVLSAALEPYLS
ncbi:MAG: ferrochelatase [Coriobacteriales bacterium]|jgi:ferrochelatase|nr:ferrochelatase [Coriobacteriales bacterium]